MGFSTVGFDVNKINKNQKFDTAFNVCNFSIKEILSIPRSEVLED